MWLCDIYTRFIVLLLLFAVAASLVSDLLNCSICESQLCTIALHYYHWELWFAYFAATCLIKRNRPPPRLSLFILQIIIGHKKGQQHTHLHFTPRTIATDQNIISAFLFGTMPMIIKECDFDAISHLNYSSFSYFTYIICIRLTKRQTTNWKKMIIIGPKVNTQTKRTTQSINIMRLHE